MKTTKVQTFSKQLTKQQKPKIRKTFLPTGRTEVIGKEKKQIYIY